MTNVAPCLQKSIDEAMLAGASIKDAGNTATAPTDTNIAGDVASIKAILETMVRSMHGMEGRMQGMEGSMQGMEGRMQGMEGRMQGMEGRMQGMEDRTVEMDVRLTGRIDNVMTRLGQVELRYATYGF